MPGVINRWGLFFASGAFFSDRTNVARTVLQHRFHIYWRFRDQGRVVAGGVIDNWDGEELRRQTCIEARVGL
jgi:hypothetical protein